MLKQVKKTKGTTKLNLFIKIKLDNDSEWITVKVLSFQPKRIGRNKKWLNVHVIEEERPQSIDWSCVELGEILCILSP